MKAMVVAGGLPQIYLIKELKKRNIQVILLDGNENAIARPFADLFYKINIFDIEGVENIAKKEAVDFLITVCADQVLLVVAEVSEKLGLPWYIDFETAQMVSDKMLMKKTFIDNEIPTSRYVVLDKFDLNAVSHLNYPLIVKPVDAYSSKGVQKVYAEKDLEKAFEQAIHISRNKKAIIEEFFDGEELSIDLFVINRKANILCISNSEKINDDGKFVIYRGRYPVHLSNNILKQVEDISQKIVDAFNIENAPMLIQMLTDGERITVLEFCARTGGGMKWLLIKESSGVDVISGVVDLTLGKLPNIENKISSNQYIVNDFIYCKQGVFDHLEGFDEQIAAGNIFDYKCIRPRGLCFSGDSCSSSDRVAGVMIKADTIEEFNEKHTRFVNNVKVMDSNGEDIMRHDLLPGLLNQDI